MLGRRRKPPAALPGARRHPSVDRAEAPSGCTTPATRGDRRTTVDHDCQAVPCARWYVPGEETPDLEHCARQNRADASEVWLALVLVAVLVLALCCLTAVGVTATRHL